MCEGERVAKMIQIRNVSDALHAELVRRARLHGQTLTAYLEELLEREVARPPVTDVLARIEARRPFLTADGSSGAKTTHEVRREMEEDWDRLFSTRRR
jgi:plasmid stability protein